MRKASRFSRSSQLNGGCDFGCLCAYLSSDFNGGCGFGWAMEKIG